MNDSNRSTGGMKNIQNDGCRKKNAKVYNVLGQEVATLVNEKKEAGKYQVIFDGSRLSSGVYFYRLVTGEFVAVKKFLLFK